MTTKTAVKAPAGKNYEPAVSRCDTTKVTVGSVFTRHSFGEVLKIEGDMFTLCNASGMTWDIGRDIVEREFSFADQFDREETVTRTKLIDILTENAATAMTLNYHKKVDPKTVADTLKAGSKGLTQKAWLEAVEAAVAGEVRTMIGYHTNSFDEFRRLKFNEHGVGQRLVDPRTLNWIICGRVRYNVKQ